jgi:ABC-type sugar transport system ATPase subunit
MSAINLINIKKNFGKTEVIRGIDLDIVDGEFVVFVGGSGCGKSTLLRLIAGLEEVTEGTISIGNKDVTFLDPSNRGIAMVFQSYALYPHLDVYNNMSFGMKMTGEPEKKIKSRVALAAKTLQLENLLMRKPKELSGGQRQRVAIGRAIVRDPDVFLFDEPLSNLDAELRVEMRLQISKLHKELKNTMVYVTHDQVEAMTLADKIVILKEGKIEQVGSPLDIYNKPINQYVACFIGSPAMNIIPAKVVEVGDDNISIALPDNQQINLPLALKSHVRVGENIKFGIRPEHLSISGTGDITLVFNNEVSERLGSSTYLFGQISGVDGMKVHISQDIEFSPFESIKLNFEMKNIHLFTEDGICISN